MTQSSVPKHGTDTEIGKHYIAHIVEATNTLLSIALIRGMGRGIEEQIHTVTLLIN